MCTTLRRCPFLKALYGVLPCRYPIVVSVSPGRAE